MMITKIINRNKKIDTFYFQNILCIREDEIGDLCYSLPVFKSLKNQFPNATLSLLCKPSVMDLVRNDPNIQKVTSNWNELSNDYDLMVDLRGSWKSNWYALTHRPKVRLDRGSVRYRNKIKGTHPHELITNLQVVEPIVEEKNREGSPAIYLGDEESGKVAKFLSENNIRSYAMLHAGARRMLRKWPLSKYAALAVFLKEKKQMEIIFCGDKNDLADLALLEKMVSFKIYSVAGIFNLLEFSALVSQAKLFVGNESGPLHIASVQGVPSLGLYGPGEPDVFYPKGKRTTFLHHVLECNPCDQIHCVHPDNPCIQRISMEEVCGKIDWLLS